MRPHHSRKGTDTMGCVEMRNCSSAVVPTTRRRSADPPAAFHPGLIMAKFEYAPAPESRSIVSLRESYGLFIDGEFTPGAEDRAFKTISPASEEVLAEVTEAGPPDVGPPVTAPPQAHENTRSRLPRPGRGKYPFRDA